MARKTHDEALSVATKRVLSQVNTVCMSSQEISLVGMSLFFFQLVVNWTLVRGVG